MIQTNYNPDVLSCLANLSSDEVFTPPALANDVLDLLPVELWSNPDAKFLDPVCKTGVFLREMAKRLMKGLENIIPDKQQRINHIFSKQLFGIALTELTGSISRRSVYCTKTANNKYSVCETFTTEQGNILYKRTQHNWGNGRCTYCGASQEVYERGDASETYAYSFIHTDKPAKIFNMKFDVIVGNPPYQLSDGGGTGDSAKPIYHLFIENALKLRPKYLTMIVPSRWMKGGKGLDNFRAKMIQLNSFRSIVDYEDAKECFSGLHIDGGVCFFLIDREYNGQVEYTYISRDGTRLTNRRYLGNPYFDKVVRDHRQLSIIEKVFAIKEKRFSAIVYPRNPFGISADFFNNNANFEQYNLSDLESPDKFKIYGVKGKKGGARRVVGYIDKNSDIKNIESVYQFKLFFSKAYMTTSTIPPKIIIGAPNSLCTETFLLIGTFKTLLETENCLSYIKTKFFRALLFFNRSSLNISRESFELIPIQSFSEPWTDKKLYKKYGLSAEEITFIENKILPMD